MPTAIFEPAIAVSDYVKWFHALSRSVDVIGNILLVEANAYF
jgi:hypothetical protein